MTIADLAILGGGCSGLSLGRELARAEASGRRIPKTVILEPRLTYTDDRTWCFWATPDHSHAHLVRHHWHAWEFSTEGQSAIQKSQDNTSYQCISAGAFYSEAIEAIERADRVTLKLRTRVKSVSTHSNHVVVETCGGTLRSKWVVDTRPQSFGRDDREVLRQVFVGAEVRTERDAFDPLVAGLMTNMCVDDLRFRFTYLLPFSRRHALVEETRFSTQDIPRDRLLSDLDDTLSNRIKCGGVETLRTEAGCILMTTEMGSSGGSDRVVLAGTVGGAVRASSGYAFLRIQRWARHCASRLYAGAGPVAHPAEPIWRSSVDRLFLRVLCVQPGVTPSLFMSLGSSLSAKTLVRFLSDDCRPIDFIRVASVLPKRPFLRELIPSIKWGRSL